MIHKKEVLQSLIVLSLFACPSIAGSQSCGFPEIMRDNVYFNIIIARNALETYETINENIHAMGTVPESVSWVNQLRGEIFAHAVSAYLFGGALTYPADSDELLVFLDSIPPPGLKVMEFPKSLESLVACGILPHLPESPYSSGSYFQSLPEDPEPGDIYYSPIAVEKGNLFPDPGHNEGSILAIFDLEYEFNQYVLSENQLKEMFFGDLDKFLPRGVYNTICFIDGSDPDSW